jgi:hypothetical protein
LAAKKSAGIKYDLRISRKKPEKRTICMRGKCLFADCYDTPAYPLFSRLRIGLCPCQGDTGCRFNRSASGGCVGGNARPYAHIGVSRHRRLGRTHASPQILQCDSDQQDIIPRRTGMAEGLSRPRSTRRRGYSSRFAVRGCEPLTSRFGGTGRRLSVLECDLAVRG